jgi:hypothetical protein
VARRWARFVRQDNMTDDQFYEIWNRACTENGGPQPLEGDVALTNMLLGHGYIMNGGREHFGDLSEEEQRTSISGFRYFSFNDVADLILKAPKLSGGELDAEQNSFVEFDSQMLGKVRSNIVAHPHQFRGALGLR